MSATRLTPGRRPLKKPRAAQRGAALPMVLLFIAATSIILGVAYNSMRSAVEIASALRQIHETDMALLSAEEVATFNFLTSAPTNRGLAVPRVAQRGPSLGRETDIALYWKGDGSVFRLLDEPTPVLVSYQDLSGLINLMSVEQPIVAEVLQAAGIERDESERLAAALLDYSDLDETRRRRGAERLDYRLHGASSPTNSPLRFQEELMAVLGFPEAYSLEVWRSLEQITSFTPPGSAVLNTAFAVEGLDSVLVLQAEDELFKPFSSAAPSNRARFYLTAVNDGMVRRRTVELVRTATAADLPYRRRLVSDRRFDDTVDLRLGSMDEIAEFPGAAALQN